MTSGDKRRDEYHVIALCVCQRFRFFEMALQSVKHVCQFVLCIWMRIYLSIIFSIAGGFALGYLVDVFFHMSGGHLNPALTIGFLLVGQITLFRGKCTGIVQLVEFSRYTHIRYPHLNLNDSKCAMCP